MRVVHYFKADTVDVSGHSKNANFLRLRVYLFILKSKTQFFSKVLTAKSADANYFRADVVEKLLTYINSSDS